MPMDIPVIQVEQPTAENITVLYANNEIQEDGFRPLPVNSEPAIIGVPTRLSVMNTVNDTSGLVGYINIGSATFKITRVYIPAADDDSEDTNIPIDPKTWIDNYGNIHVGPSNISDSSVSADRKVIEITATFHYVDPSTGDVVNIIKAGYRVIAVKSVDLFNYQTNFTAIRYQPQPGTNG